MVFAACCSQQTTCRLRTDQLDRYQATAHADSPSNEDTDTLKHAEQNTATDSRSKHAFRTVCINRVGKSATQ